MINAYDISSVEACGTAESCLIHVPVHFPRSGEGTMGVKRHLRDIYLLQQKNVQSQFFKKYISN